MLNPHIKLQKMKKTSQINNLNELENELSRLESQLRSNRLAIAQQWESGRHHFLRLSWRSIGMRFNRRSGGTQLDELKTTAIDLLLKWIRRKFK